MDWLPRCDRTWLRSDLIAGLAIWAVTVPQSLAYAGIAGVPAVYGLYTVPLAMVGYAIFGTPRTLSVGPDSATVVLSAVTVGADPDPLATWTRICMVAGRPGFFRTEI